jgi:hypothetical protein
MTSTKDRLQVNTTNCFCSCRWTDTTSCWVPGVCLGAWAPTTQIMWHEVCRTAWCNGYVKQAKTQVEEKYCSIIFMSSTISIFMWSTKCHSLQSRAATSSFSFSHLIENVFSHSRCQTLQTSAHLPTAQKIRIQPLRRGPSIHRGFCFVPPCTPTCFLLRFNSRTRRNFFGAIAKTVMFDIPIVKMDYFLDLCKNSPVFWKWSHQ